MKVDVIQTTEATFCKWRWWSNWVDVAVFDYGHGGYLLQMQVSRRNEKRFKAVAFKAAYNVAHASIGEAGNLTRMKSD